MRTIFLFAVMLLAATSLTTAQDVTCWDRQGDPALVCADDELCYCTSYEFLRPPYYQRPEDDGTCEAGALAQSMGYTCSPKTVVLEDMCIAAKDLAPASPMCGTPCLTLGRKTDVGVLPPDCCWAMETSICMEKPEKDD